MSNNPMLFCGIGWMKAYKGLRDDEIKNGGAYVKKTGLGHECYNFLKSDGKRYYGYVEHNRAEIHIERLGADKKAESIEGVTVVWFARSPAKGGLWIVGWYKNATVYRAKEGKQISTEAMAFRDIKEVNTYCITSEVGMLLNEEERTFTISGPRRAHIWYGDDATREAVKKYIEDYEAQRNTTIDKVEEHTEFLQGAEREAIIKQRVNQELFRQMLLKKYKGCCLCGLKNQKLLIASHIKPWSSSDPYEKLDDDNGLLLCPNHDKLFDMGLISFEDDGTVVLSNMISSEDRTLMNVRDGDHIEVSDGNAFYLKYHRENVFIRE